jgi:hypothetical protein
MHTRSDVRVGALVSYWLEVQLVMLEHVVAELTYCVAKHDAQTRFEVGVAATD